MDALRPTITSTVLYPTHTATAAPQTQAETAVHATGDRVETSAGAQPEEVRPSPVPFQGQQAHYAMLGSMLPAPVAHAAYFGSGPDAEWLLMTANPKHGWMFDRIAAVPGGRYGYEQGMTTREAASYLQGLVDRNQIGGYAHGFFRPEMDHTGDLGARLTGGLLCLGADDLRIEAADERRIDFKFNWQHPEEAAPSARTISLVWSPDAKHEEPALLQYMDRLPPMQFLMTRGFNDIGNRVQPLRHLAGAMAPDGVAFLDFDLQHDAMQFVDGGSRDWSMHGSLHAYRKTD